MPTFAIESNGRLDKTAIYYNGSQLGGIKEVFLNINEDGAFDAIVQYEGTDKNIYTKQIFSDYLNNIKIVEASFTDDDAADLVLLAVESDGDIDTAEVFINDNYEEGIVELLVHIKSEQNKKGLKSILSSNKVITEDVTFKSEITYRNDDDTIETEEIF